MSALTHPAVAAAIMTCESCPDQWEGELTEGRGAFYFRYRSGRASLAVGPDRAVVNGVCTPAMTAGADVVCVVVSHGDALRGMFESDAERSEVFARLWDLIEEDRL